MEGHNHASSYFIVVEDTHVTRIQAHVEVAQKIEQSFYLRVT